jgi:hypothetical protein
MTNPDLHWTSKVELVRSLGAQRDRHALARLISLATGVPSNDQVGFALAFALVQIEPVGTVALVRDLMSSLNPTYRRSASGEILTLLEQVQGEYQAAGLVEQARSIEDLVTFIRTLP